MNDILFNGNFAQTALGRKMRVGITLEEILEMFE